MDLRNYDLINKTCQVIGVKEEITEIIFCYHPKIKTLVGLIYFQRTDIVSQIYSRPCIIRYQYLYSPPRINRSAPQGNSEDPFG